MISVEPTRDKKWLWEIATHPAIYEQIGGGVATNKEAVLAVVDVPENHFLKGVSSGKLMGFFAFHWLPEKLSYDLHICVLPAFRGAEALTAFRLALLWVFESTPAKAILALFLKARRDVRFFITKAGFKWQCFDRDLCYYKLERTDLCLG